jgi:uncharacterized membrane protein
LLPKTISNENVVIKALATQPIQLSPAKKISHDEKSVVSIPLEIEQVKI